MPQATPERRLNDMIDQIQSGKLQMSEQDAIAIAGELYMTGRYREAAAVCQQIIALKPQVADAHSILGVTLSALGQVKEGVASLKSAIKLSPTSASFRSNLGEIQRQSGNLADAIVSLQEALELNPKNPQAHNNLGIARFDSRNFDEAAAAYLKAIELKPDFAEAYNNLGNALRRLGNTPEAIEAYQNALAVREDYPEAYNNLGTILHELNKTEQAEHALRKAITQNPRYAEARINLAVLYWQERRDVDALRELGEALNLTPKDVRALVITARVQQRRGNYAAAERAARLALQEKPEHAEALTVLGSILHELDRLGEAVSLLEKAAKLAPDNAETLTYCGIALKSVGRLDDARKMILDGVQLNPNMIGAYANLGDLVDYTKEKELYKKLQKVVENMKGQRPEYMLPLHYAYAKALEDNGKFEDALGHYIAGGKIKRSMLTYDEAETLQFFDLVKETFTAEFIANSPFEGNPTDRLLFIVGMPRSGSTLVEQILASNDAVHGAGEVKYFSVALHKLRDRFPSLSRFPQMVREMKPNHFKLVADQYSEAMFRNAGDAQIVSDKLLTNYFFIGLLHMLFPNAKFINTRRDPIDSSLSTFTKLFKDDMPHSYDMGELGRYYRQYDSLMAHWEKVIPKSAIKVVEYENVVADTEKEARALIEFLGLKWDAKMLDFHKSSRPVKTASVAQVRKPIYNTAVNRWKKYGSGLQPLIDAIEKA